MQKPPQRTGSPKTVFFLGIEGQNIYIYTVYIYIYIHPCRHPVTIQRSEIKAAMLVCAGMMLVMWWSLFVSLCLFCMVFGSLCWSRRVQLHHAPSVHQAMQGRGNWVHVAVGTVVFPLLWLVMRLVNITFMTECINETFKDIHKQGIIRGKLSG